MLKKVIMNFHEQLISPVATATIIYTRTILGLFSVKRRTANCPYYLLSSLVVNALTLRKASLANSCYVDVVDFLGINESPLASL